MTPRPEGGRRPRFRRVEPPGFALTERDIEIIRAVHRHRFLRSTHVVRLLAASPQPVLRRLQLLYHAGFLDRPRTQIDYFGIAGSKPIVYGLGNRGADLLAERFGVAREKVDWTAKNRGVSPIFLEHTLLTADFMVALTCACREHGHVRVIDAGEILARAPASTRAQRNPFGWTVTVPHGGKRHAIGVIPDRIFGLHFAREPEGRNRAYFFLEADRATMPVERSSLDRTSFFRKLLAYHETWRQGLHTRLYGIKAFRVLTVTSSADRVRNLREAARKATGAKAGGLFLFTDMGTLENSDALTLRWASAGPEAVRLID